MSEESLKIAVFIDFDNIEIGVKTTLNREFDVGAVLDAVKERGEVITKVAFGDWKRAGDYSRMLTQHAVRMVQRNMTPGGDKNGADINLALDALEMAFTHDHINAFVIVGGDSDFISLVEKLKQYDRKVFVVGGRQFTAMVLQKNCHEFIAYETLIRQPARRQPAPGRDRQGTPATPPSTLTTAPVSKAFALVTRALQLLIDREVTPQLGLLKSTLLQLDSTFSERDYGASSFRDFAEKLAEAGLVTLRSAGRSLLVELRESEVGHAHEGAESGAAEPAATPQAALVEDEAAAPAVEAAPVSIVDGIHLLQRVLQTPGAISRWPMYIRNVKQAMRAVDPGFDERRHGNLVDIVRACQRDGLVRLERDRQGVLRVFQGPQFKQVPPADGTEAGPGQQHGEPMASESVDVRAEQTEPFDTEDSGTGGQADLFALDVSSDASQTAEPRELAADTDSTGAKPRRRRRSGAASPKAPSTVARRQRARATSTRTRKDSESQ